MELLDTKIRNWNDKYANCEKIVLTFRHAIMNKIKLKNLIETVIAKVHAS